jgi:hypothetical protein
MRDGGGGDARRRWRRNRLPRLLRRRQRGQPQRRPQRRLQRRLERQRRRQHKWQGQRRWMQPGWHWRRRWRRRRRRRSRPGRRPSCLWPWWAHPSVARDRPGSRMTRRVYQGDGKPRHGPRLGRRTLGRRSGRRSRLHRGLHRGLHRTPRKPAVRARISGATLLNATGIDMTQKAPRARRRLAQPKVSTGAHTGLAAAAARQRGGAPH